MPAPHAFYSKMQLAEPNEPLRGTSYLSIQFYFILI